MTSHTHRIDIIGDIHGELEALIELGRALGYEVDDGWSHSQGRVLVFVGDLIDRGPDSLGVAELVCNLIERRRAVCLLGNHEYNLVGHAQGHIEPKASNKKTIEQFARYPKRSQAVLDTFRLLPTAIELPALRIIHAVWHLGCYSRVAKVIGHVPGEHANEIADTFDWLQAHVVVASPFTETGLICALPAEGVPPTDDTAHEILIKGYEAKADAPFLDSEKKERTLIRVTWWDRERPEIPSDKRTVFGHYWNLPPIDGVDTFVPPYPSGTATLGAWQAEHAERVIGLGSAKVPDDVKHVCVDYNGVKTATDRACVGAYRWPEAEVVWAAL
jgi:hypothetical protein